MKRYRETINFISGVINHSHSILDLGIESEFSSILKTIGYNITNTQGEDLDIENDLMTTYGSFDVITAFEILEHLLSPFELLRKLPAKKLVATVPLRLWFSSSYKNDTDPRDRHFHEFEDWQFDWLLEKAGWTIVDKKKWTSPSSKLGIRPVLRSFYPRYYAVYAERS